MKYQAIFFDFDGVILDSVHIKTRTFAAMFSQYGPDIEEAVVDYHLANGGVSRFKKFEYYYNKLLNKPIAQEELDALGEKFSSMALQGVLSAPFIPGALETLKQLKAIGTPCFVASGTPNEEIKLIVQKKNLSPYFMEVHGSPRTKDEIISDISGRYGYEIAKCLFIGDAMTDYKAAKATGCEFLGIVQDRDTSNFPDGTWISRKVIT